jgi:peptidoglycan/LPS O-acetylase OafA/YrhL
MSIGTEAYASTLENTAGAKFEYRMFGALRLGLAVLVLLQHTTWLAPEPWGIAIDQFLTGDIGVLSFFVLSGFIIVEAACFHYRERPLSFLANRSLRIGPPFVFALVISILVHWALNAFGALDIPEGYRGHDEAQGMFSPTNILLNFIYVLPVVGGEHRPPSYEFLPYTWAIYMELTFYVFVAVAIVIGRYLRDFEKALSVVLAGAILAYVAFQFGHGPSFARFTPYFALGGAMFFLCSSKATANIALLTASLFGLALYDFHSYDAATRMALRALGPSRLVEQYVLFSCCLLAMPLLFSWSADRKIRRLDKIFGNLSYPFYLNQFGAIIILYSLLGRNWFGFALAFPCVLLLSHLANTLTEPLVTPLRDKIRGAPV